MQTYTPALVGGVIGVLSNPNSLSAQLSCALTACGPDLVMVPRFLVDKRKGKLPLANPSSDLRLAYEITHSLPIWILLCSTLSFFVSVNNLSLSLSLSWLSHLIIDALTHCDSRFAKNDQTMLWPLKTQLGTVVGIWDYRYDYGILRPKPFETLIDLVAVLIIILSRLAVLPFSLRS